MIIVRLMGGLGNQLFQYALGRHLSLKIGAALRLDCSFLSLADTPYPYELKGYHVAADFPTAREVRRLSQAYRRGAANLVDRMMHRARFGSRRTHIIERTLEFDPDVLEAGDDVLLEGYWQSPRYFEAVEAVIRGDLRLREQLPTPLGVQAAALRAAESVCVHVRRGDYVDNPRTAAVHGLCGAEYYAEAARHIVSRVPDAQFHVFSNDPDWVREQFRLPVPFRCVDPTGDRAHATLEMMSSCRHFIIANSSYSWWAAWLSASERKIVVAPRKWGNVPALNTASRFPEDWIVL